MGELGDSYESAFNATAEAYIATAKAVGECNIRYRKAVDQINKLEAIYKNEQSKH